MSNSEIKEIKSFHYNGELEKHCFYKDSKWHGECKWYYNNGKLGNHCFYKDGKPHGENKTYYKNGQLSQHSFWKDGKKHGEYKSYRANGELQDHCFLHNDIEEAPSEYAEDINNITDDEFMNLSMLFGNNFFASKTFTGVAS